ncbi:LexA family transcriptional regulator [Pseudomonas abietaniphila]|nr:LexA family transcriptional regulator [Pseudomonas abietaniphila]
MKKRPLTEEQLAECAALKAIYMAKKDELGLTQEKAGEMLGMNQGSFSHYLNGRNALNLEFASRAAVLFGVPVSAFSTRLAEMIDALSISLQGVQMATREARRIYQADPNEISNITPATMPWRPVRSYPMISWVAAGARAESPTNLVPERAEEYYESTENAGNHGFWLEVKGASMTAASNPSFPEGTRILVQPEGFEVVSGKYYVAQHSDGEATFKQYVHDAGWDYLVPLNTSFKTVEMDENWEIIGRVVDARIPGL